MKRVLSIATLYPNAHNPRFGTFVARSLEALAARGDWQVTVINPLGIPPLAMGRYASLKKAAVDGEEHGIDIHRPTFTLIPKLGGRFNASIIARTILPTIEKMHRENPFDLVDAQFFYPDGPAAARIARKLGLPLSIKARGADISYWGHRDDTAQQMLDAASEATGVLAVSEALKRDMADLGMNPDRISIHYTGLDRDRFRPLGNQGLRRMLGESIGLTLPDGEMLLATVGALIPRKGQELVIGALAEVLNARLLLVGQGQDEKHLRTFARDIGVANRVHFLGSIDHDLLPVVLSAADAMVLPSASEGLANAWVESLACGTPLVITDAGGARELVTNSGAGQIVERSLHGVAQGIREIRDNPPDQAQVLAAASKFSWEENAAALARHYDLLLEKHQAKRAMLG